MKKHLLVFFKFTLLIVILVLSSPFLTSSEHKKYNLNDAPIQMSDRENVAKVLNEVRGSTGPSPSFLVIKNTRYWVEDFYWMNFEDQSNDDEHADGIDKLVAKFKSGEISDQDIQKAYQDIAQKGEQLWKYLQPFLQYLPERITALGNSKGIFFGIKLSDLKLARKLTMKEINTKIQAIGTYSKKLREYAGQTSRMIYNAIAYDLVSEFKRSIIWYVLWNWFNQKLYQTIENKQSIQINKINYNFKLLFEAKNKDWNSLNQKEKRELQKLVDNNVDVAAMKTALNISVTTPSSPKNNKSTNKNLAIGLGTTGGIVALAGAGGFAYWFIKVRK